MNGNWRMPTDWPQERMWTLSHDHRTVHMRLPPLPLEGLPEPVNVTMDFDADTIDFMIDRLAELRARMLPAPHV